MKTAYHLINFGVWKERSEDDKLKAVRQVGYTGVEGLDLDYTVDPARQKDRLDSFGLQLAVQSLPCMPMGTDDQKLLELARKQVEFANIFGCNVSVAMVPRTDGDCVHTYGTTLDHYQELARRLNLVGKILADGGCRLAIHNHIDHMSESTEEMEILMHETNEDLVGICFDTAHAVCGGNDPLAYARRFAPRIWHLHLKDTKNLLFGRPYFFKNVFLPLGEGVIDFPAIMAVLDKYDGWVTVEMDGTFSCGDPQSEATISLKYLHE
jgi:inosose dehydratase